ncbi:MAG: tRNA (guanosine(46)-N7)-methyltransferase TrmB, partial [Bacilli bacterium]
INMAINNPNKNYIGIEKYSSVISYAIKKINSYKEDGFELNNLKLLNIDVKDIPNYLYNKIDTIYLNFSDPWPKKRYAKRRLTHENFLKIYDNLFEDNNKIILKTDNDDFFNFSKESLLDYDYNIIKESKDLHLDNIINSPMTEYEEKFSNKAIKIKYLEVLKEK